MPVAIRQVLAGEPLAALTVEKIQHAEDLALVAYDRYAQRRVWRCMLAKRNV